MDVQIPLNKLKFGHEDGEGINARVIGRDARLAELAANLHAHGQIENLVVKPMGDGFYSVANGNRRLAAFHLIHGETSSFLVNCTIHEVDETRAFEYSLATAITAEQLHPVDQYEAFARLEAHGKTNEEIARQYGLTEKQVRQALALGRLAPVVRNAWRAATITADAAKAFTLALDHGTQEKLFAKLEAKGDLNPWSVRAALGAGKLDHDVLQLLDFVGAEAYRARGGEVIEDLFGHSHIIQDADLLKAMAREKLTAECEQLRADGWSWAEIMDDLPKGARYWPPTELKQIAYEGDEKQRLDAARKALDDLYQQDDYSDDEEERLGLVIEAIEKAARARSFTAKRKAELGCIVDVENGHLVVSFGIKRPAEAEPARRNVDAGDIGGAAASTSTKPKAPDEPEISQALKQRLGEQLTKAAATALIQDEQLALSVLLAGFCSYDGAGVKVSVNGLGGGGPDEEVLGSDEFPKALRLAMQLKPAERITLLADIAARALNFRDFALDNDDEDSGAIAICNALDPSLINPALRGAFDAKDYFAGVSKALSLKAIEEALGPDLARQQAKGGKAEITAFAIENVPPTGWLPPQLRPKGYDGPPVKKPKLAPIDGGKAAAKPKGKAAPAKPAKAAKPVKRAASAKKAAKKTARKR
ncbi:ParB N-terminal domain-containing protein [Bradyrhizobium sp. 83012]|uniref:ParB N-terminal domain-containing protein n=2 Tax=Bradyrhizobium aeschynomenes TaxID=2734909 RepID=A0ABX2CPC9_9BRAD|nr:ParB N-terminal domain-containing protein [Bradyrhizobium aeschynomenes]NPU69986.1 ParB N-terminal domain-containing protein [Bradyrhizobium aeschynomenes]